MSNNHRATKFRECGESNLAISNRTSSNSKVVLQLSLRIDAMIRLSAVLCNLKESINNRSNRRAGDEMSKILIRRIIRFAIGGSIGKHSSKGLFLRKVIRVFAFQ
jgi:hypothetical protein